MSDLWQVLECIVVPLGVGASMYGVFELWDRRRRRNRPDEGLPLIDYSI